MKELRGLTGLRFVAALWVMVFHSMDQPVAWNGYLGVSVFFVLSGFVLGLNYLPTVGRWSWRDFFQARAARVLPLYGFGIALGLLAWVFVQDPRAAPLWQQLLGRFTFTHAWVPGWIPGVNIPTWSLSVEAFFYLLFPVLAIRINRWHVHRCLGVLLLLLPIPVLVAAATGFLPIQTDWHDPTLSMAKFWPAIRLPEFVAGVLLARLRQLDAPIYHTMVRAAPWGILTLFLVSVPDLGRAFLIVHSGGMILPILFVLAGLADGHGLWNRLLSMEWMVVLGRASYALYLIHVPVLALLPRGYVPLSVYLLGYWALAIGLSLLLHRWIEEPARKAFRPKDPERRTILP